MDCSHRRAPFYTKCVTIAAILMMAASSMAYTAEEHRPAPAPMNPELLRYLAGRQNGLVGIPTSGGHGLGAIPSPIDHSHMRGMQVFSTPVTLPASYDLRAHGRMTSVKNQGMCASCWAFATFGSLESCLLARARWNFSENNLIDHHGWDYGSCSGGNSEMAAAYLSRWAGPMSECDDPYQHYIEYEDVPAYDVQKHIQDICWLPDRKNKTDNATIKQALMTYGAVYVEFYMTDIYFTTNFSAYYCPKKADVNHAVVIAGWNDRYSRSKFTVAPPGDGALLCKNSWGTEIGTSGGYFWMSYYDRNLWIGVCFNNAEPPANYTAQYLYDPLGWVGSWGWSENNPTAWIANVFRADSNTGPLRAVSTYSGTANTAYELYIYDSVRSTKDPRDGTLKAAFNGIFPFAGYHTIRFPSAIAISPGKKFSVVMQLTTPGYYFPIPMESYIKGMTSKARSSPGQSYASGDGTIWEDVCTWSKYGCVKGNVCLKAFTEKRMVPSSIGSPRRSNALASTTP